MNMRLTVADAHSSQVASVVVSGKCLKTLRRDFEWRIRRETELATTMQLFDGVAELADTPC